MPSSEVEDVRSALQSALGLPVRFLGSTYSAPAALASTAPVALAITISLSAIASDFVLSKILTLRPSFSSICRDCLFVLMFCLVYLLRAIRLQFLRIICSVTSRHKLV
jgi:ribosomal protein L36